jgi:chromosome partitioning protein
MKKTSVVNNKGGVGKTTTVTNMSHILSQYFKKKVLLVDLDPQGNATKFLGMQHHNITIANVLTERIDIRNAIYHTEYENLDIITANEKLKDAFEFIIKNDNIIEKNMILKNALRQIENEYDFCFIDNSPYLTIGTDNALVASDDVIVPLNMDIYGFWGLNQLTDLIQTARETNPSLFFRGCLVTKYVKDETSEEYREGLKNQDNYPVFTTHIRETKKMRESTFSKEPITEYSRRSSAAVDYMKLAQEYLNG